MKLAIVGSRNFTNWDRFREVVTQWTLDNGIPDVIVSGGANGADTMAEDFAKSMNIPTEIFLPDWNRYGRGAGIIRNGDIVKTADAMIAFPLGESRGTWNSISRARAKGIPVQVIEGE